MKAIFLILLFICASYVGNAADKVYQKYINCTLTKKQ